MIAGARRIVRARLALAVVGTVVASTLLSMPPASAAVGAGVAFTVPDGAPVGSTNLSASLTVTNTNSPPNQAESNTINEIRFVPSCGSPGTAANPCPTPDSGAISINPTATGAAGTVCAGRTFTVSGPDASGAFLFTPSGGAVVLAPPGGVSGSDRCTVNFSMNVIKVPTIDVSASPGVQTWVNLRAKLTSTTGLMPVPVVSQMVTVSRGVPSIATQASPSVAVGGTISDTATVTAPAVGAAVPTGTVSFSAFGPNDATCSGVPMGQSTNPVAPNGSAVSTPFPVSQPGTYRFVAVYNGDANYAGRTSPCNAVGETVTVTPPVRHVVADFDGNGTTDLALFRPPGGRWLVKGIVNTAFGLSTDIPVPADYNGDGRTDIAVYRPSTGQWFVQGMSAVAYGNSTDVPVPADYNGDGRADIAVYRPSTGQWFVTGMATVAYGNSTDVPVPGDYNGDGRTEIAVYRPSTHQWFVRGSAPVAFGVNGDVPVPGDYNGDGRTDIAVFRPSTRHWLVRGISDTAFGAPGDVPEPGDYNGDGRTDLAVFRPSTGHWLVMGISDTFWGASTDVPLPLPYAIRRTLPPPMV